MTDPPPVVAVFGATALGKSDVALALARRLDADIVVADSMQIYAGLTILTNQPGPHARARARYHLVGWASPQHEHTVAEYAELAHEVVDGLLAAGRRVIVEGGSGLYVRAVLGDLAFGAAPDPARRHELEARWERAPEDLVHELIRRAPDVAARTDLGNARRVIRALESLDDAGVDGRDGSAEPQTGELWKADGRYPHRLVALVPEDGRAALMQRIARRVDEMLAAGALEEVAAARAAGPFSRTAAQAIGVRELCAVLDGELALEDAAARMKTRTRALARRQLTWLRKLPDALKVPATDRPAAAVAADVQRLLETGTW
jgi:tRNA dimethylallyltransferase